MIQECKDLIATCDRLVGVESPVQTDHGAAAKPNGAHNDDAGNEPLAGAKQ